MNKLEGDQFIEIFNLQEADDSIFENYQRYDFYQVVWFTKVTGDNTYFIDFREYKIEDNQIVIVFPGQIDMLDVQGKEGYLFAIHNENFFNINQHLQSDYLNGYSSNVFISVDNQTKEILHKLMELILQEYNDSNRITLMESYMEAFLFHVSSLFESNEKIKNKSDEAVAELMRYIDTYFISERETDFYADKLGVSNRKLNELSIKGTGKTIKQHLQERLILEIKKEIRLKTKSLKEIAFDLGFSEPAYFTRFFKQQTGMTPSEFRDK
ncbi:AraC family transcriptional regulator [Bacteroides sp. 224]|nr:AraC family transcriptional regulator [Bacteroides sp. 224]